MYKIKRHILLNMFYIHDQYSGPISSEYEIVEEVKDFTAAHNLLKEYQATSTPNIDGFFEDYYKYEHMKEIWGDPGNIQPSIGQLFFICRKELFGHFRTLYELIEVESIEEPYVFILNHATSKKERLTFGQFQGLALLPERHDGFIQQWESRVGIRYPRNLISSLMGIHDYRQVRHKCISISKHLKDWDLPKGA